MPARVPWTRHLPEILDPDLPVAVVTYEERPHTLSNPFEAQVVGALAGKGAPAPAWLLTHPKTEERIRAIEANEARWLRGSPDAPA